MIGTMSLVEREKLIATLSYSARVAFIAFCAERCIKEAQRYPAASEELRQLPLLTEALAALWSVAEGQRAPDDQRLAQIREHLLTYERRDDPDMRVVFTHDATLVYAAWPLLVGIRTIREPSRASPTLVATAVAGPTILVSLIYQQNTDAMNAEQAVLDRALEALLNAEDPISRTIFDTIPDWPRGQLRPKYAERRLIGIEIDEDDE